MKTRLVVSLAAALALMIFVPTIVNAAGVGKQCGGFVINPQQCNPGLFCQRHTGQCFIFDISGTCARVPHFCPHIVRPVCGCDSKTYNNDCERQRAMVSKLHDGKCS
jgi:Kazal-type serine protease inhibitor-like protein